MLSVLMATYHGEQPEFLRQCLDSLAAQTRPADEIVLVKDGALTEALDAVLAEFSHLPIRPTLYEGDGRLGGALAHGLTRCQHRIVARMDSDDIALPDRLEVQLAAFQSGKADLLSGHIDEFDEDPGNPVSRRMVREAPSRWQIQMRNPINHMAVMLDRDAALAAGNYRPLSGFEDWYLWLRMAATGARIRNMQRVLVLARTNAAFIERRSGQAYRAYEQAALARFRAEGLIGWPAYLAGRLMRMVLRALPSGWLARVYTTLLRRG